jgi:hypothetical protein
MNIKRIALTLIVGVFVLVIGYALLLLFIMWPIGEFSVSNAGVFGDSFGILTSLFSGLAFSGMIITILLQRDELRLQRYELIENRREFSKSADAQERSAQLSALSAMLNECEGQVKKAESELETCQYLKDDSQYKHLLRDASVVKQEIEDLKVRKTHIMKNIETILESTGIHVRKT